MVIVMAPEATKEDIDSVVELVRSAGGEAFVSRGVSRTIIGLVGDVDNFGALNLRSRPGVGDVMRISVPYKLVSREHHRKRSVIRVAGVPIGPSTVTLIAGPCSVETPEQTVEAARMAKAAGAIHVLNNIKVSDSGQLGQPRHVQVKAASPDSQP